jgi:hypothetical protein
MSPREDKEPKVSLSPSRTLAMCIGLLLLVSGVAAADTLTATSSFRSPQSRLPARGVAARSNVLSDSDVVPFTERQ